MSRKVEEMHPDLRAKYLKFVVQMQARNIPFIITSVDRTIIEQMALYVQGRLALHDVNKFRKAAGLWPLQVGDNKVVTWTLESLHVTNPFDKKTDNDKANAFDIAIMNGKRASWNLKISVNKNEMPDYQEAGEIWTSLGGVWGGNWSDPDYPHFQL